MFYYVARKFIVWALILFLFLEVVLTASVYLRAFVSYQPLPLALAALVAALQLPDSLRFACCLGAFCFAAAAVESRHILLMRSVGAGARTFLLPVLAVSLAVTAVSVFHEHFGAPLIRAGLARGERAAMVRGVKTALSKTGQFRIGRAAFTAGSVEGEVMHRPLCFVGDLLVRGVTMTTSEEGVVLRDAQIRDVKRDRVFHAGSFFVRFPDAPTAHSAPDRWVKQPWRAHLGMCRAMSVVPLVLLGLIAGLRVGRLGQLKAFLLFLFLTFVLYLGIENALYEFARDALPVAYASLMYLWSVAVAIAALPPVAGAIRARAALGIGEAGM